MIGILNYNMGNLLSVKNALDYLELPSRIIDSPKEMAGCDKLILPGVGAFGQAMEMLNKLAFTESIQEFAAGSKPVLGICLGMQLLFDSSLEHGFHKGLGLIHGSVKPLKDTVADLRIPHVGWNNIIKRSDSRLLKNIEDGENFYFVHSYYCHSEEEQAVAASAEYGTVFDAVVEKQNIFGCQFHPEKSQAAGLTLLKNFGTLS